MRIQHNIMAMSAYRNYTNNVSAMQKNLEKLSSGYKINRAGDDAAGLAISEKMRAQITGLETAQKNAKDGISLVQTAEGALTEVHDMLNRMVELASQSANGTYDNTTDRAQMQKEINQLRSEIDRIADSSNFNGIKLLDGSMSTGLTQVGSTSNFNAGTAAVKKYNAVASGDNPLTWVANSSSKVLASATIGQVPSTGIMHLHSGGDAGSVGEFTIDLGGLNGVSTATNAKGSIKITLTNGAAAPKTATATIAASTNGGAIDASRVKTVLEGMVLVATKGGTLKFAAASANAAIGDLVYKISGGTTASTANVFTFKAVAVAKKASAYSAVASAAASSGTATKLTTASSIPDTLASAQEIDLNFTVSASKGNNTSMSGFQQVGVTKYTNTKKNGGGQLGQAVVKLDATKLKDGMKIIVNGVEKKIRLSGTAATDGSEIDLTKIAKASGTGTATTYSIASSTATRIKVAQKIANAFAYSDTKMNGVEVGVNAQGHLVIAEKDKGGNVSAATSGVQKKMSTYEGFKSLVEFQTEQITTPESKGSVKLNIDADKVAVGTTLTLTSASGGTKKYAITNDPSKTGTDANGATYVQAGSNVAAALKTAIENDGNVVALGSDGKTITVTYQLAGGTKQSAVKAKAEVVGQSLTLQIGDTAEKFNQLKVDIGDMHTTALGIDTASLSIADQDSAAKAVDKIKAAINQVSDLRGTLGATQNRLDHTINNLSVMTENIQDAESTIRDVDVAEEMMAYTKNNILIQSAQAMLAQANQVPQGVLQLLQ